MQSEENRAIFFVFTNDVINRPKRVISLAIYAVLSELELNKPGNHKVG